MSDKGFAQFVSIFAVIVCLIAMFVCDNQPFTLVSFLIAIISGVVSKLPIYDRYDNLIYNRKNEQ